MSLIGWILLAWCGMSVIVALGIAHALGRLSRWGDTPLDLREKTDRRG